MDRNMRNGQNWRSMWPVIIGVIALGVVLTVIAWQYWDQRPNAAEGPTSPDRAPRLEQEAPERGTPGS